MDALVRLIAAREVTRQYLALAHRRWQGAATRQVDAPIGRDPRNRLRMAVVDLERHPGKPARTLVELLRGQRRRAAWCAARWRPAAPTRSGSTWRRIGHPLVADALYGGAPAAGLTRQALHAFRLAFVHPVTRRAAGVSRRRRPPDLLQALRPMGAGLQSRLTARGPRPASLTPALRCASPRAGSAALSILLN